MDDATSASLLGALLGSGNQMALLTAIAVLTLLLIGSRLTLAVARVRR